MTLFARLVLLIALSLAPAICVQIWNEIELRQDRLDQLGREVLRQAQLVASDQDEIIQGARNLMIGLDRILASGTISCEVILQALGTEYRRYPLLAVFDRRGEPLCSSAAQELTTLIAQLSPDLVLAMGQEDMLIGKFVNWNGLRGLPLFYPMHGASGDVRGVNLMLLDLDWVEQRLNQRPRSAGDVLMLTDRDATILARAPVLELNMPKKSPTAIQVLSKSSHEGTVEFNGVDGVRRVWGFVPTESRPEGILVLAGQDKVAALAMIDRASFRGAGLIFLGSAAALVCAFFALDWTILRPVRILRQAALDWQKGAPPSPVALRWGGPELQDLANSFSEMAQAIAKREQAWREACVKAEEATKVKNRLLAAAGHDLRQPLNAIALCHEGLRSSGDSGRTATLVALARRSVSKLARALDTMLEASRFETGLVQPKISDFALAELFEEIREEWSGVAEEKGLVLRFYPTACWVRSDRDMLESILGNFVSNSIRYTERGGVLVGCHKKGENLQIAVYDTGIGIPTDALEQIFEECRQLDPAPAAGFGLGLSIVRRTADLLNHPVNVVSRVGKGSRFSVFVPWTRPSKSFAPTGLRSSTGAALEDGRGDLA